MERKTKLRIAGAAAVVALMGAGIALTRASFGDSVNSLGVDLQHPDVLIRSARLGQLPKDLVQAPLLNGILTEDFVHYYEDHPTRLSLLGSIKRLAYDHKLTIADRLIATVLDAPGELALWHDHKGRPDYFVLMLEHNLATQAALQLAKVALPDKQMTIAGEVGSPLGKATVYALKLNGHVTWLIASRGSRTVVLSDPGLLLEEGGRIARPAASVLAEALDTKPGGISPFAEDFGLPQVGALRQQIAAKASFLSFGYAHFFPGVDSLKLELSAAGAWSLAARAEGAALNNWGKGATALWASLPRTSALCAALPLDPQRLQAVISDWGVEAGAAELLPDLEPVGAVCWGTQGGLFAPMLALRLRDGADALHDDALPKLLAASTRSPKKAVAADEGASAGEPQPASEAASAAADDAASEADVPVATDVHAEQLKKPAGGKLWTRTVAHEFGAVKQGAARVNVVAVARMGKLLIASTDARMVRLAISVGAKAYPALGDQAVPGAAPVLAIDGAQLSRMLEAQTWRTLRPSVVPTFTRVAHELLPPRLQAIAQVGRVSVGLPDKVESGSTLHWVTLLSQQTARPLGASRPAAVQHTAVQHIADAQ